MQLHWEELVYAVNGKTIVGPITYRVPPGRLVALVGPNGAGKTTLLRMVAGLLAPSAGRVVLQDRALTRWSRRQLAQQLSWVPQDTHIEFAFPVREVVMMGRYPYLGRLGFPRAQDHRLVQEAMQWMQVGHLAEREVTTLSGGERQRVLLARALASDTPAIVLDEPTASLDIAHQLEILSLCRQLTHNETKTVLMAIHDLNLAWRFADEVILLGSGQCALAGPTREVLVEDRIQEVFGVRAEVHSHDGYVFHRMGDKS